MVELRFDGVVLTLLGFPPHCQGAIFNVELCHRASMTRCLLHGMCALYGLCHPTTGATSATAARVTSMANVSPAAPTAAALTSDENASLPSER